jgi:hypothetical protein
MRFRLRREPVAASASRFGRYDRSSCCIFGVFGCGANARVVTLDSHSPHLLLEVCCDDPSLANRLVVAANLASEMKS